MVSLATGSSYYSVVTPATGSEVGSVRDAPLAPSNQPNNFFGGFRAQLRALVAPAAPQKETRRSKTLTSRRDVRIADDSDLESATGRDTYKVRRPPSPVALFYAPEMVEKRKTATKENQPASRRPTTQDHPAYRTRGRKASRVPS